MKQKDIEQLKQAGLLSEEQAAAIATHIKGQGSRSWQWLLVSLSSLAGALILGGIIMLISANWESIPDWVKMAVAMALLLGFWLAWGCIRTSYPRMAEALGLVGGGMWLGCIALYGQIFQLQNPFVEGLALFLAGICLIPFVVQQRLLLLVVAVSSVCLLMMLTDEQESWLSLEPWLNNIPCEMCAPALLALLWWLCAEHWRGSADFTRNYAWLGIPAMLMYLGTVHIPLLYNVAPWNGSYVLCGLVAAVPVVLLLARPETYTWPQWLMLVLLLSQPLPLGFTIYDSAREFTIVGVAAGFALGGGLMYLGNWTQRMSLLNYGSLVVLLSGIALIANVLDSLAQSGVVLVLVGVLLLVLVLLLERQRRRLAAAISEKNKRSTGGL